MLKRAVFAVGTAGVLAFAALAQPQTAGKLPIAPGVWLMASESCASARYVDLYDGQRWGTVSFVTNDPNERPSGGLDPIVRTRALKNGFTEVWWQSRWSEPGDRSNIQVRPDGPARMTIRTVSPDSGRIQSNGGRDIIDDQRMVKCDFAALPARMKRAVREFAPGLDPQAGIASNTAGALASGLRWRMHNFPDGRAASFAGPRNFVEAYLRCRGGSPVFEIMLSSGNRSAAVTLTGKTSGRSVRLAMGPMPGSSMTSRAPATAQAVALLRGNDPAILVQVDGKADGEFSLMDANPAIDHVAAMCPALRSMAGGGGPAAPGPARPAAPAALPTALPTQAWDAGRLANGSIVARVAGPPALKVTALRCERGVGVLHMNMPNERGMGSRNVEFIGRSTGQRARETLQRNPETGQWSSGTGAATRALFEGRDPALDVAVNGAVVGTISLVNAAPAIRSALAGCPVQQPGGAGAGSGTAPGGTGGTVPPLNIVAGYYVTEAESCQKPFDIFYYDGKRFGYYVGTNGRAEVKPAGSIRQVAGGWELRHGNGPRDWPTQVRVLSATRIQLVSGPPMRWCPAAQLPAKNKPF